MGRNELAVAAAGLAAAVPVVVLGHRPPMGFEGFTTPVMATTVGVGWIYLFAGVLVRRRRSDDPTGTLLLTAGTLWFVQFLFLSPVGWLFVVGIALGDRHLVPIAHLLLVLPDRRLGVTARRLAVAVYVTAITLSLATPFVLDRACPRLPCPSSRPTVAAPTWFQDVVLVVDQFGTTLLALLVGGYVVIRLVRSDGAARRAIAPVLLAGSLLVPVYASSQLGLLPEPTGTWLYLAATAAVPLAVLSGLAWARVHRGAVADLVVALDHGVGGDGLREALARCLGDPSLRLLFPHDGSDDGYFDADGRAARATPGPRRASTTVAQDGRAVAVFDHDRALLNEPELLDAAVAASRLALRNARLTAQVRAQLDELQRSRTRLVLAVDQERRRLERDLHDGVQQQLLAVALELGRLRRQVASDGHDQLGRSLERTRQALEHGIDELRRFARGIHPQVLTDRGVPAALEALAQRAPLPITIDTELERLPSAIESTLYLIAAEAVTNTIRHGDATHLRIHARCENGHAALDISDDGRGGAQTSGGSGLQGLEDRVAALGGTIRLDSPRGRGTRLHVNLPLSST
ncbi:sensor histidine kinase [Nitriliruptor alkaliphilus]|uniref:sensor histidine kinase n=1 Tax=Nitriliruptor alkaliphilus TaxID=427918 RepID=UPI0009FAC95B|nr:sensor histidine kinase [Nitriliruptor alkaliphilus]